MTRLCTSYYMAFHSRMPMQGERHSWPMRNWTRIVVADANDALTISDSLMGAFDAYSFAVDEGIVFG